MSTTYTLPISAFENMERLETRLFPTGITCSTFKVKHKSAGTEETEIATLLQEKQRLDADPRTTESAYDTWKRKFEAATFGKNLDDYQVEFEAGGVNTSYYYNQFDLETLLSFLAQESFYTREWARPVVKNHNTISVPFPSESTQNPPNSTSTSTVIASGRVETYAPNAQGVAILPPLYFPSAGSLQYQKVQDHANGDKERIILIQQGDQTDYSKITYKIKNSSTGYEEKKPRYTIIGTPKNASEKEISEEFIARYTAELLGDRYNVDPERTEEMQKRQTSIHRWRRPPHTLLIPICQPGHWRMVKIHIDYTAKKASILWDDPMGGKRESDPIYITIKPFLHETINKLAERYAENHQTTHTPWQEGTEITFDSKMAPQQTGVDCGAIVVQNIRDYVEAIREAQRNNTSLPPGIVTYTYSRNPDKTRKKDANIVVYCDQQTLHPSPEGYYLTLPSLAANQLPSFKPIEIYTETEKKENGRTVGYTRNWNRENLFLWLTAWDETLEALQHNSAELAKAEEYLERDFDYLYTRDDLDTLKAEIQEVFSEHMATLYTASRTSSQTVINGSPVVKAMKIIYGKKTDTLVDEIFDFANPPEERLTEKQKITKRQLSSRSPSPQLQHVPPIHGPEKDEYREEAKKRAEEKEKTRKGTGKKTVRFPTSGIEKTEGLDTSTFTLSPQGTQKVALRKSFKNASNSSSYVTPAGSHKKLPLSFSPSLFNNPSSHISTTTGKKHRDSSLPSTRHTVPGKKQTPVGNLFSESHTTTGKKHRDSSLRFQSPISSKRHRDSSLRFQSPIHSTKPVDSVPPSLHTSMPKRSSSPLPSLSLPPPSLSKKKKQAHFPSSDSRLESFQSFGKDDAPVQVGRNLLSPQAKKLEEIGKRLTPLFKRINEHRIAALEAELKILTSQKEEQEGTAEAQRKEYKEETTGVAVGSVATGATLIAVIAAAAAPFGLFALAAVPVIGAAIYWKTKVKPEASAVETVQKELLYPLEEAIKEKTSAIDSLKENGIINLKDLPKSNSRETLLARLDGWREAMDNWQQHAKKAGLTEAEITADQQSLEEINGELSALRKEIQSRGTSYTRGAGSPSIGG